MQDGYDLIVVGAGPGGSNAAAVALQAGLSVAQVDAARFPRTKPCAGALTPKACRALAFELEPSVCGDFDDFEFNAWRGHRTVFTFRSRFLALVSRPEFDNRLVEENRRAADFAFFDGEPVRAIEWDGVRFLVRTDQRVLPGAQLVGADGANGIVNRLFGLYRPRGRALAVEVTLWNPDLAGEPVPRPCFDFGVLPRGYGWVFPKGERVSVGLYTLERGLKDLRSRLGDYLLAKGFRLRSAAAHDRESAGGLLETFEAHPIPLGGRRARRAEAPIAIVGDAGGFADALTGEGIYHALESGRLAGETAVDRARGRSRPDHHERMRATVLRDADWTWRLADVFYRDPARWLRLLESSLLWRPLVHGTGCGATFGQCLMRAPAYLARSGLEKSARRTRAS